MIAEYKLSSVPHLLECMETHLRGGVGWIYRGQARSEWDLRPKAGRPEYYLQPCEGGERRGRLDDLSRFAEWRREAVALNDSFPKPNLECLAYAQHYGLATRLLDWTTNPLVALFFAVEAENDQEGSVFAFQNSEIHVHASEESDAGLADLKAINYVARYDPRPIDRRILAQSGVFTYHPDPNQPLKGSELNRRRGNPACADQLDLVQFNVDAVLKLEFKRQLANIGFSRKTLFPDLEGLSMFMNWRTEMMKKPEFERKCY
jgi:hypothetical protein